jgi:hypothetical protein
MNATYMENRSSDTAAYGGMLDAVGGIATAALAIIALAGLVPEVLMGVATIVFGAALVVQAGALLSEYSGITFPSAAIASSAATDSLSGGGLGVMFMAGAAGIVLGILALLGIAPIILCAAALIAFGASLLLGSSSMRNLYQVQSALRRAGGMQSSNELLASEMAAGSAGAQLLSGLAAIVLGIVALSSGYSLVLTLVGLLVVGVTNILSGGTLSGVMMGLSRSEHHTTTQTTTLR